eukprot:11200932-Lingulodinium_polyedra.AAC.1
MVLDEEGKPMPWDQLYAKLGVNKSSDNSGPLVFSEDFVKHHASRAAGSVTAAVGAQMNVGAEHQTY